MAYVSLRNSTVLATTHSDDLSDIQTSGALPREAEGAYIDAAELLHEPVEYMLT